MWLCVLDSIQARLKFRLDTRVHFFVWYTSGLHTIPFYLDLVSYDLYQAGFSRGGSHCFGCCWAQLPTYGNTHTGFIYQLAIVKIYSPTWQFIDVAKFSCKRGRNQLHFPLSNMCWLQIKGGCLQVNLVPSPRSWPRLWEDHDWFGKT